MIFSDAFWPLQCSINLQEPHEQDLLTLPPQFCASIL
jgi:hypothetical protein